jgi:tRNA dimethylallyltransferase
MTPDPSGKIPVVLIMGPTGAGKTDLAMRLSDRLPVDIVSVDSAMVYRGLDIGTGKPDAELLRRHPHHLVDILDPSQAYSAGQFVRDAHRLITEIHARGRVPLLVGGTMLYFRALRRGIAAMPVANPGIRAEINAEAAKLGWPELHAQLALIDRRAAARIQPNDGQRIQRALEVFRITGRSLSDLHTAAQPPDSGFNFITTAWTPGIRERLYAAIDTRFHAMMERGLLGEVEQLFRRGDLNPDLPALRSVGYRQLWEHLSGAVELKDAVTNAIFATRHLARRQLIWLRAEDDIRVFDPLESAASAQMEHFVAAHCPD